MLHVAFVVYHIVAKTVQY